jgi:hypothetical protein
MKTDKCKDCKFSKVYRWRWFFGTYIKCLHPRILEEYNRDYETGVTCSIERDPQYSNALCGANGWLFEAKPKGSIANFIAYAWPWLLGILLAWLLFFLSHIHEPTYQGYSAYQLSPAYQARQRSIEQRQLDLLVDIGARMTRIERMIGERLPLPATVLHPQWSTNALPLPLGYMRLPGLSSNDPGRTITIPMPNPMWRDPRFTNWIMDAYGQLLPLGYDTNKTLVVDGATLRQQAQTGWSDSIDAIHKRAMSGYGRGSFTSPDDLRVVVIFRGGSPQQLPLEAMGGGLYRSVTNQWFTNDAGLLRIIPEPRQTNVLRLAPIRRSQDAP